MNETAAADFSNLEKDDLLKLLGASFVISNSLMLHIQSAITVVQTLDALLGQGSHSALLMGALQPFADEQGELEAAMAVLEQFINAPEIVEV